jgi:hypothetical protein
MAKAKSITSLIAVALVAALAPIAAHAQLQSTVTYPPPTILSGLVPAPIGGEFNSPSLTITIPAGVIFMPGNPNQSLAVAQDTYTYSANAVTNVCVNVIYGVITHQSAACSGWNIPLYTVATGTGWLDYVQGQMPAWPSAFPMPEVAENPVACSSKGGVAMVDQSLCINGNWSIE